MDDVASSTEDYEQHKIDVERRITERFGEKRAKPFMERYAQSFDKFKHSYLDYKLAFKLYDDWHAVKNKDPITYAFVGKGGAGKSTLMKNVLGFLDPEFNDQYVTTEMDKVVDMLDKLPVLNSMRAIGLDEPDDGFHPQSKEGKQLSKIVGKWRQQGLFFGICATDLANIPNYIYKKVNVLFYLPYKGVAFAFRDLPKKGSNVLSDIKEKYRKGGWQIFHKAIRQRPRIPGARKYRTMKTSPFDILYGAQYERDKAADYKRDIKIYKAMRNPNANKIDKLDEVVLKVYKKLGSERAVADALSLSNSKVHRILLRCRAREMNIILDPSEGGKNPETPGTLVSNQSNNNELGAESSD